MCYEEAVDLIANHECSCSVAVRLVVGRLHETLTTQRRYSFLYSTYRKGAYW